MAEVGLVKTLFRLNGIAAAYPLSPPPSQDLVDAIRFLHNSPAGTRVMCDSNTPEKLLSQFVVDDADRLLLNDLDAVPLADRARGRRRDEVHALDIIAVD